MTFIREHYGKILLGFFIISLIVAVIVLSILFSKIDKNNCETEIKPKIKTINIPLFNGEYGKLVNKNESRINIGYYMDSSTNAQLMSPNKQYLLKFDTSGSLVLFKKSAGNNYDKLLTFNNDNNYFNAGKYENFDNDKNLLNGAIIMYRYKNSRIMSICIFSGGNIYTRDLGQTDAYLELDNCGRLLIYQNSDVNIDHVNSLFDNMIYNVKGEDK